MPVFDLSLWGVKPSSTEMKVMGFQITGSRSDGDNDLCPSGGMKGDTNTVDIYR